MYFIFKINKNLLALFDFLKKKDLKANKINIKQNIKKNKTKNVLQNIYLNNNYNF